MNIVHALSTLHTHFKGAFAHTHTAFTYTFIYTHIKRCIYT